MYVKKKGLIYKVSLIGDSGVGKTSLIMAALGIEFNGSIPPTIQAGNQCMGHIIGI
jgi:GTPase SAR1 family protein